jgi:hypothetical protein
MRPVPELEWQRYPEGSINPEYLTAAGLSGHRYFIRRRPKNKKQFSIEGAGETGYKKAAELDWALNFCQSHYRDALKAQEKWSAVPPVEPGDYHVLRPGEARKAQTFTAKDMSCWGWNGGTGFPEGTLFQRIPEPAEPYDFS